MLTFEPHPLSVLHPEATPRLLTRLDTKAELIASLGVEELVIIPFDHDFAKQSAEDFVERVLLGGTRRRARSRWARTSASATGRWARPSCSRRARSSRRASSRWSRSTARSSPRATSAGWCSPATSPAPNRFLGDPFQLRGTVVSGDRRGRGLGYPDRERRARRRLRHARPRRLRLPGRAGAGRGRTPPRSTSACARPSTRGRGVLVEAYVLDVDADLYGRRPARGLHRAAARGAALRAPSTRSWSRWDATWSAPASCYRCAPHDDHPRAQAASSPPASARASRTPAAPRCRSRC